MKTSKKKRGAKPPTKDTSLTLLMFEPDANLSFHDRVIYSAICQLWFYHKVQPSSNQIRKWLGFRPDTITASARLLQELGMITEAWQPQFSEKVKQRKLWTMDQWWKQSRYAKVKVLAKRRLFASAIYALLESFRKSHHRQGYGKSDKTAVMPSYIVACLGMDRTTVQKNLKWLKQQQLVVVVNNDRFASLEQFEQPESSTASTKADNIMPFVPNYWSDLTKKLCRILASWDYEATVKMIETAKQKDSPEAYVKNCYKKEDKKREDNVLKSIRPNSVK